MDDSVIVCDETIEETVPTNFNKKMQPVKQKNYHKQNNEKL